MSACALQTFSNITQNLLDCLEAAARSQGYNISGKSGSYTQDGFTVTWNYNPSNETLQIQCIDSPWYVPCSVINGRIHDLAEQYISQCSPGYTVTALI